MKSNLIIGALLSTVFAQGNVHAQTPEEEDFLDNAVSIEFATNAACTQDGYEVTGTIEVLHSPSIQMDDHDIRAMQKQLDIGWIESVKSIKAEEINTDWFASEIMGQAIIFEVYAERYIKRGPNIEVGAIEWSAPIQSDSCSEQANAVTTRSVKPVRPVDTTSSGYATNPIPQLQ